MSSLVQAETAATPQLRWSSVRSCPRKAAYEAAGAPHRERSREEEGWLWRGRQLGRDFVIVLAAEQERQGKPYRIFVASGDPDEWPARWTTRNRDQAAFICEEPIEWPLGVMHPDIRVVETNAIVEILSSAHASEAMLQSKRLQLVGQIEHGNAAGGAVVVVNPSNPLDYEIFPIARTSAAYNELVDQMRERIAQVQAWAREGTLPARVCAKPSESRSHFCLHAEHCFDGWERPDLPPVEDPLARELVQQLYVAKQAEREQRTLLSERETVRKEIEQQLDDVIPVGKHQVGSLEIARTHVERKPTFQWEKAEAAGVFAADAYPEFFKPGAAYDTWRVDRVSDAPLAAAAEFGDVPFHGDERDAA